jgi:hypothetical protein
MLWRRILLLVFSLLSICDVLSRYIWMPSLQASTEAEIQNRGSIAKQAWLTLFAITEDVRLIQQVEVCSSTDGWGTMVQVGRKAVGLTCDGVFWVSWFTTSPPHYWGLCCVTCFLTSCDDVIFWFSMSSTWPTLYYSSYLMSATDLLGTSYSKVACHPGNIYILSGLLPKFCLAFPEKAHNRNF